MVPLSPFIVISVLMIFILLFFSTFLFYRGRQVYSNVLLGLYLASQIIGIINAILFQLKEFLLPHYVHFFLTGYPVLFTWLVMYYFFICSLTDSGFRLKAFDWLHFIPFILVIIILMKRFYFLGADEKLVLLGSDSSLYRLIRQLDILFSIQILVYNVAAIARYYSYRRKVRSLTSLKPENDTWVRIAIFTFLGACFVTFFGKFVLYSNLPLKINWLVVSYMAFLFFYSILFFVAITSPDLVHPPDKKTKYWYSKLSSYEAKELMIKLDKYIGETQIYRRSKLTIKELAAGTGINERHISQAINDVNGQNFSDYINTYRIEHAKGLLNDVKNSGRTMFDIFWESGFNSKTTFNTCFKKFTGMTPSDYQKMISPE